LHIIDQNASTWTWICIGSNESHHKTTKVAAKVTQKDVNTFEKQVSDHLDDMHTLDLAMEEINGRPLWHYFHGYDHKEERSGPVEVARGGNSDDNSEENHDIQEFNRSRKTGGLL